MFTKQQKIDIFKNVFKGRDDVFATRWENVNKSISGYTPACENEWKKGLCNKLQKRKCKDCASRVYVQLNDFYIEQHLRGNKVLGVYPLLKDNVSYFIVADFDGEGWKNKSVDFINTCKKYKLPAYLEKSRSGNGGHVWMFFENKYPAYKSRNIVIYLLKECKIISQFEKDDSFDRLFPNQDFHSKEGLGNLVALPLQGKSRNAGNSVFIDYLDNFKLFEDQWRFLSEIEKVELEHLENLYSKFNKKENETNNSKSKGALEVVLKEKIFIDKNKLSKNIIDFLKDNLNLSNLEFLIKKKMSLNTYGLERYFKLINDEGDEISIPRGFLNKLINFLQEEKIDFKIVDKRNKLESIKFESNYKLFDYQEKAIESVLNSENGLLVAPPSSGKTVMGIDIINKLEQPALILVHKKEIFNQWVERVENFLNIPKKEIGQYVSGKKKIGDKVTVAMIQTFVRMNNLDNMKNKFGLVIVDECHHVPAKLFRNIITKLNPYYLYGLTATPERKNNDEELIFVYLGEILYKIKDDFRENCNNKLEVITRKTNLSVPFKVSVSNFALLAKIITFDSNRNEKIILDIKKEINNKNKCLVLSERKEHLEVLNFYLKSKFEVIQLTGDLSKKERDLKMKQISNNDFQVILATGQLIGEGVDFKSLNCLFLTFPFSFHGKLTQYIGRVQRDGKGGKKVYDYRDEKISYVDKFFKNRLKYYKKKGYDLNQRSHQLISGI